MPGTAGKAGVRTQRPCRWADHRAVVRTFAADFGRTWRVSRAYPRSSSQLASRRLDLRWVSRGGGCILHAPGQLAIYPLMPLAWHGWSVGRYMQWLHQTLLHTVRQLGFPGRAEPGRFGVWGRSGQLAACGVAVRHGVTFHGAFLNVDPHMDLVRLVDAAPAAYPRPTRATSMSCLVAEYGRPVKMTGVRSLVIQELANSLPCQRYHVHTGHPLFTPLKEPPCESPARDFLICRS